MTTLQHVRDQHDHVEMLCKSQEWDMTPDQLDRAFLLSLIDEHQATIERVRELPDKWRKDYRVWNCGSCFDAPADTCIDELLEALGDKL